MRREGVAYNRTIGCFQDSPAALRPLRGAAGEREGTHCAPARSRRRLGDALRRGCAGAAAQPVEAVAVPREDRLFAEAFGQPFIDYILTIKEAEIARFLSEVTDWEHREYFELF